MKYGIVAIILLIQASCAMKMKKETPTTGEDLSPLIWETKASIHDIRKNKTNQISIDLIAIKNQKLRLEASATLGYQVGSLIMSQTEFIAIINGSFGASFILI